MTRKEQNQFFSEYKKTEISISNSDVFEVSRCVFVRPAAQSSFKHSIRHISLLGLSGPFNWLIVNLNWAFNNVKPKPKTDFVLD